jgi:hypothetical protein
MMVFRAEQWWGCGRDIEGAPYLIVFGWQFCFAWRRY